MLVPETDIKHRPSLQAVPGWQHRQESKWTTTSCHEFRLIPPLFKFFYLLFIMAFCGNFIYKNENIINLDY